MFEDDLHPFSWPLWVVVIPLALVGMCSSGDRQTREEIKQLREEIREMNKK